MFELTVGQLVEFSDVIKKGEKNLPDERKSSDDKVHRIVEIVGEGPFALVKLDDPSSKNFMMAWTLSPKKEQPI